MSISWAIRADALLRGRGGESSAGGTGWWPLLLATAICGVGYGAIMGTFGGITGERGWQVLISGAKVPLLLLVTYGLSLPSFFVLNTLLGLRADFPAVLTGLTSAQAVFTLVLLALAPYTVLGYASTADHGSAVLFNGLIFAVASLAAQTHLRRHYRPLIHREPRHRTLLRLWLIVYVFVGIQTAWMLRPFVGHPDLPVQFFRPDAWGNAYVAVAQMLWRLVAPGP